MSIPLLPGKMTSVKVDLHVHTPASKDYLGQKGEQGYRELVGALKKADVDVIAVTDHNTIHGYLDLMKYKSETISFFDIASRRGENIQLDELREEVSYLNRLYIMPAVEISCFPGVHLILIFSEDILPIVDPFLTDEVFKRNGLERGDPKFETSLSPVQIIELASQRFGEKFIAILPHVDSSKGIWKELEGLARANIIKNEYVHAAQVSNPDSINKIKDALKNTEYRRTNPLSFIQASDFHGAPATQPAQQYSKMNISYPINFEKIKNIMRRPDDIENSFKFVKKEMDEFCKDKNIILFQISNSMELSEAIKNEFVTLLCAFLNTKNTILKLKILNVDSSKDDGSKEVAELIKSSSELLDPPDHFAFSINEFHENPSRRTYCVSLSKDERLRLHNGACWIWDKGQPRAGSARDIECIVSDSMYSKYGKSQQYSLEDASEDLMRMSHSIPAIPIMNRISKSLAKKWPEGVSVKFIKSNNPPKHEEDKINKSTNGYADGDYIAISHESQVKCGRLARQNSYHRILPPRYRASKKPLEPITETVSNCVLILPGGAIHYVDKELPLFNHPPLLKIDLNPEFYKNAKEISEILLGLTIWFKSNFVAWHVLSVVQSEDLWDGLLEKKRVVFPHDISMLRNLSHFAETIIALENAFLRDYEILIRDKDKNKKKIDDKIEQHNSTANRNMRMADAEIFRNLEIEKNDKMAMMNCLKDLRVYSYEDEDKEQ